MAFSGSISGYFLNEAISYFFKFLQLQPMNQGGRFYPRKVKVAEPAATRR